MSTPAARPPITEVIDPDEVLRQEFTYARDTALQANNDRTQMVSLYLLLVGGLGSVLAGLPVLARGEGIVVPRGVYALVLLLLAILGLFNVLKLIRLRLAWHDSVLAMNQIKDFYLAHFPDLAPAFRWRTGTIPEPGRIGTLSFDLAVLVALIDSLALGGGILFLERSPAGAALGSLAFLGAQVALYLRMLRRPRA